MIILSDGGDCSAKSIGLMAKAAEPLAGTGVESRFLLFCLSMSPFRVRCFSWMNAGVEGGRGRGLPGDKYVEEHLTRASLEILLVLFA